MAEKENAKDKTSETETEQEVENKVEEWQTENLAGAEESIKASEFLGQGDIDDFFNTPAPDAPVETVAPKATRGSGLLLKKDAQKHERLPILDVVFDKFVQYFSLSTRNFLQTSIETRNISISNVTFGEYLDSTTLPALFNIVKIEEWETTSLVTINNNLIYSLINILLGGKKNPVQKKEKAEGRAFSRLETNLVERFIRSVLDDLRNAFAFLHPIQFHLDRQETIPKLIGTLSSTSPVSVCSIKLVMGDFEGLMEIVLPHASFDPIREKLVNKYVGDTFGPANLWQPYLEHEIRQVELELSAVLFEETFSLLDVIEWKKGTTLNVDAHKLEEVKLQTLDRVLLEGKLGHHNNMMAVEVDHIYLKDA
jgi:flagellar motor switch protein FliM